ncbi:MAG TPA: ribosome small subunit-dependent GTPase A [Bacillota bacterium]|nr:ribosome small subunit-dependent GTPase A [Bacillota bacterium]
MRKGRIVKALSGFYYVQSDNEIFACKGRGVFRKRKITPLVGDFVEFEVTNETEGYVTHVRDRTNSFTRPQIANIEQAIVVSSAKEPDFSTTLLDRFLVLFEYENIEPLIIITKVDLLTEEEKQAIEAFKRDYEAIGYEVELISTVNKQDLSYLNKHLENKVSVITGQSGVGKSSILNEMNPSLLIETDEISTRLGRGKHTTRHVELLSVGKGLIADTPGFSSLDLTIIEEEYLTDTFPEMHERKQNCRFRGCLHNKEPHCAIKSAVEEGTIKQYRYASYLTILTEIQTRKVRY